MDEYLGAIFCYYNKALFLKAYIAYNYKIDIFNPLFNDR